MRQVTFALMLFVLTTPGLALGQESPAYAGLRNWVDISLHAAAGIVGVFAVLIMLWGVARTVWRLVGIRPFRGRTSQRDGLRSELGYFILLGLEFLIVADVIQTITAPDLEHVLVLGLIVLIRTVIAFSLNWELTQEAKHGGRYRPDR